MGLTLSELNDLMSPITKIGKGDVTFDLKGTVMVLRTLEPEEEIEVQRYARAALADGDATDQSTAIDYLDRFRSMSLGYSLMRIGDFNFTGLDFVETGDVLPNGTPVKVRKHEAVMGVIAKWSRHLTTAVFRKFGELSEQVESDVDKVLVFEEEEVDIDTEIARLEEKITELKDKKTLSVMGKTDPRAAMRDRVTNSGPTHLAKPKNAPAPEVAPPEESFPPRDVHHAVPVSVSDETDRQIEVGMGLGEDPVVQDVPQTPSDRVATRRPVFEGVRMQAPVAPPVGVQDTPRPSQATPQVNDPLSEVDSSFSDVSDPVVIEAENRRIQEMRSKSRAPHLSAREASREVQELVTQEVPSTPSYAGKLDGMDVYKMPTQTLTGPPDQPTPVRPPAAGSINPRFRPR